MVTNTLKGGSGSHIVRLLKQLQEMGWQANVVCYGQRDFDLPPGATLVDRSSGGRLHHFPIAQSRELLDLRRTVMRLGPHLVHAYFFWPIMYARALKRLGTISHLVENREDQGFNWSAFDYRLLRLTASVPDRIICVSNAVREVVLQRERTTPTLTQVVRNGVTLPTVSTDEYDRNSVRAELGFSTDHLVVGMVANLDHAVKGADYFIEAMPFIAEHVPDARFVLLGDGRLRARLEARVRELGVDHLVAFPGFRRDMDRVYPALDMSVLTSLSEGLSMTLLESMSFGLPVVATQVGGNPELVQVGITGELVPPRSPSAFAETVIRLLQDADLRASYGQNGRLAIGRTYSLAGAAEQYDTIYRAVLSGARS